MINGIMFAVGMIIAQVAAPGETLGELENIYTVEYGNVQGKKILNGELAGQYRVVVQPQVNSHEQEFLNLVNNWRSQNGRPPVGWDSNLAYYASLNTGIHNPGTNGGGMQCWASPQNLISSFYMWINSGPHASILLNATSAIGAAICPSGATANCR
jgi:hypothetical protein